VVVGTLGAPPAFADGVLVGLDPDPLLARTGAALRPVAAVLDPLRDAVAVLAAREHALAVGGRVLRLPAVELVFFPEEPQAVLLVGVEPGVEIPLDLVVRGQFHFSVIDHGSSSG